MISNNSPLLKYFSEITSSVNNNEFIDNVYVGSIELNKHTYMFSYISEQRELPKLYYFKDNKITSISQHENLKNKTECCNLKDYLSKNKI